MVIFWPIIVLISFTVITVVAIANDWEAFAIIFGMSLLVYGCNLEIKMEDKGEIIQNQ